MNVYYIPGAILAIEIVLHYSACSFIVACNPFSELGDEWIEGQDFRSTVDGAHQSGRGDNIDFAIEHVQRVYWELAFLAAQKYIKLSSL